VRSFISHLAPWLSSLAAILLFTLLLNACDDGDGVTGTRNTDYAASERFAFEIERQGQIRFRLQGINGSVQVNGVAGAVSFIIEGEKHVESDSQQDAEEYLELLDVEIGSSDEEVVVRTVQPDYAAGRNFVVDYSISMPRDIVLTLSLVNGSIVVQSLDRSITVQNVNGSIVVRDVMGSALLSLVNGQIDAAMALESGGIIDMRTTNGIILLGLPQDTSASFSAAVETGSIVLVNLTLVGEIRTANSLSGTLGGGDGTVMLRTTNGNITVTGRP